MADTQQTDIILQRLLQLHPKIIDLNLDRVVALLAKLGNPHHHIAPVVHISGTNGKGSVSAMLAMLLQAHGLRVHIYNSPHLVHFHERITLNGAYISDELLQTYLTQCETVNGDTPITFFEITTCAAFLAFSQNMADVVILETGLGGRLDATNVIDKPALNIITPISLDHQQYLGDTIAEIAFEKAGILKQDTPLILMKQSAEARKVIEKQAFDKGTGKIWAEGKHYNFQHDVNDKQEWNYILGNRMKHKMLPVALNGTHQYQNTACALTALYQLQTQGFLEIQDDLVRKGLQNCRWAARLQPFDKEWQKMFQHHHHNVPKNVWLDGSHNVMGATTLRDFIMAENRKNKMPTYMIVAMLNSKDATNFLNIIGQVIEYGVALEIPEQENSFSAVELSVLAQKCNLSLSPKVSMQEAVNEIVMMAAGRDYRLVITGSLYFAGAILRKTTNI
ncbi:MAG: bifunctional folylpolyglutamate synthase/dihydrofolate synthase [Alphaproteobacteria bacterium]|nr:bifunctional folylpolyglutamate synthase/dihydrofolate synthase [Alphaproteobacteria bacterium]